MYSDPAYMGAISKEFGVAEPEKTLSEDARLVLAKLISTEGAGAVDYPERDLWGAIANLKAAGFRFNIRPEVVRELSVAPLPSLWESRRGDNPLDELYAKAKETAKAAGAHFYSYSTSGANLSHTGHSLDILLYRITEIPPVKSEESNPLDTPYNQKK